jgi:hypothetical protein
MKAVVFLYPTEDMAVRGEGYGGSGFVVGMTSENEFDPDTPALHDPAHVYVVTNAHVAAKCQFVRTSHQSQPIIRVDSWTNHKDGDDIAIAHLGIMGLNTMVGKAVHRSYFMTPDSFVGNEIGPGDQVFMVGRFTGMDERERTESTVRAGTLSMSSTMPVEDTEWGSVLQESFFAEVNSKAGYSGSPVYVEVPPPSLVPSAKGSFPADRGAFIGLLGMTWGMWRNYVPLLDPDTHEPIPERWVLHESTGIELVIPAWRIMGLLMEESVVKHREQYAAEAEQEVKRLKPDAVATDAQPLPDEPPALRDL